MTENRGPNMFLWIILILAGSFAFGWWGFFLAVFGGWAMWKWGQEGEDERNK